MLGYILCDLDEILREMNKGMTNMFGGFFLFWVLFFLLGVEMCLEWGDWDVIGIFWTRVDCLERNWRMSSSFLTESRILRWGNNQNFEINEGMDVL